MTTISSKNLPDVASESQPEVGGRIEQVGMSGIEALINFRATDERCLSLPASCDVAVRLSDERAKGIHMSRLYLQLQDSLATRES